MNKKFGLLIILVLGVILISAIAYYIFAYTQPADENQLEGLPITNTAGENKTEETPVAQNNDTGKVPVETVTKKADTPLGQLDIERMAKSFAERFGSFSNQSNYTNITDLRMFMSEKMKKWADAYMAKNQKDNTADQVYYGLTSKALSADTTLFDDAKGAATVIVETRRREAMGTSNNSSNLYNQKITITFVKENQIWKVDSAIWSDK